MEKLKIFIVEDDFIHLSRLEMLLEELGYTLIGSADNADDAIKAMLTTPPDVLLVDIQIKGAMTGIELVNKLKASLALPAIYTTSFKDKKIIDEAIQTHPSAYLVKPYDKGNLQAAIELAVFNVKHNNEAIAPLYLKDNNVLHKVVKEEIIYIEVKDKNCWVYTATNEIKPRISLQEIKEKLSEDQFIQVHKSFIVNIKHIENVNLTANTIAVDNNSIPIGRVYKQDFIQQLGLNKKTG